MSEAMLSARVWFTTLTAPAWAHYQTFSVRCLEEGRPPGDAMEEFRWRNEALGREVTLYLKRLRKQSNTSFRYICCVEEHERKLAGFPHYHLLVYEQPGEELRKKMLEEQWPYISHHRLVSSKGVTDYVTKYLGKAIQARVRASIAFGLGPSGWDDARRPGS